MKRGGLWRRWTRALQPDPVQEIEEELGHHVEERIRDYVDRGLDVESARRAALERMGELDRVKSECVRLLDSERRTEERRTALRISWLDVKLGVRMLVKYPGLSLVAVVGMAIAIAIGAGYFAAIGTLLDEALPLDEGDRVVTIRNRDASQPLGSSSNRDFAHDFLLWRDELKTVQDLAAFRTDRRNLITPDGTTELVEIAVMTASGFRVTRVAPVLGRQLIDEDEQPGSPRVVVIAFEAWQRRFDSDPAILGRMVRLGDEMHTVVGVMPDGFRFPVRHAYWVPLRLEASTSQPGEGPALEVFGRLGKGFSLAQAKAELSFIGGRMAADYPETHQHLRPQALPYTRAFFDIDSPAMELALRAVQFAVSLLLVIVSVNVAILFYARTVTRTGEIAVRSALGASRRRIIAQLFMEALVLAGTAASIGLTIAGVALAITDDYIRSGAGNVAPFWVEFGLSPGLIVYVVLLAILAAGIVGMLPALKATGRRVQPQLQQISARGSTMQLGRTWTAFIVVQVAIAVALLPLAANYAQQSARIGTRDPAIVANDLLRATLEMGSGELAANAETAVREPEFRARYADRTTELTRRLNAEPEVTGVSMASHFPGAESYASFEIEPGAAPMSSPGATHAAARVGARFNRVAINLFDIFDIRVMAGRGFVAADARPGATAVIVTRTFAESIAENANVLGRRVRHTQGGDETGPWLEIVGVVPDFADNFTAPNSFDRPRPRLFHAASSEQLYPAVMVVRVRSGATLSFAPRLRNLAAAVDPTLKLERLETVANSWDHAQQAMWYLALGIIGVTLSVLLLSAAGIYAMMSFTVAKRRREIGIRAALGADPRRVLSGIFARAGAQLGTGVLVGLVVAAALDRFAHGSVMGGKAPFLLPAVAGLILMVGLLAALGPARRGLAVQPTEALREE